MRNAQRTKLLAVVLGLMLLGGPACLSKSYSGLLSWEEYYSGERSGPYVLEMGNDKAQLLYYGAFHSVDIQHPQFEDLERRWEAFRPDVAFSEGCLWPLEDSREEAIRRHGEQGLLRFLAARDHVPIKCLDPSVSEQARKLVHHFPVEHVKIFFILQQAVCHRSLGRDRNDMSYVKALLAAFSAEPRLAGTPSNLEEFESRLAKYFPRLVDWRMVDREYFFNSERGKFLPAIFRRNIEFRDQHMLKTLEGEIKKGRRVFSVVGRSHVVMQEPVLRAMVS